MDWRFASISGYLRWTSPNVPDGGTELFSELSPTLIIGLQEQGDVLPVDFIKLLSITSMTLITEARGVELHRDGAPPVLLVAGTVEEAQEWYRNIQAASSEAATGSHVKPGRGSAGQTPPTPSSSSTPVAPGAIPASTAESAQAPAAPSASERPPRSLDAAQQRASGTPTGNAATTGAPPSSASATPSLRGESLRLQLGSSLPGATGGAAASSGAGQPQRQASPVPSATAFAAPPEQRLGRGDGTGDVPHRHEFRPLSEIVGGGVPRRSGATTTTVTTHVEIPRVSRQDQLQGSGGVSAAPSAPSAPSSVWTPQGKTGWSPTSYPQAVTVRAAATAPADRPTVLAANRPLPSSRVGGAPSLSPIAREADGDDDEAALRSGTQPYSGAGGGTGGIRKRAGMLVDVPPNPQVNRNVAPNLSAIWKEWRGPDGVLYVFHEPTGTLQRRNAETGEFETLQDGTHEIDPHDMALRPYSGDETAVDMNEHIVKNLGRYGGAGAGSSGAALSQAASPSLYRTEAVVSPRGQYSPSRRTHLAALVPPRQSQSAYHGRRVHHLSLAPEDETHASIEHQIQVLGGSGLQWDPQSGQVVAPPGNKPGDVGASTLHRQWEHVRRILMQGRYFKKHALRTTASSFRFVFLTSDNAYVVCVPTSDVMFHVHDSQKTFGTIAETVQYYGPESRAIALNAITHVSIGSDEPFVRSRSNHLNPDATFCIVSRTHAFILECSTAEEAKYFADAWTFFLYHSKPVNLAKQRTPQMKNPITFGTRAGVAF